MRFLSCIVGVGLLTLVGAAVSAKADSVPTSAEIHDAIQKSIGPLSKTIEEYPKKVGCFSCHHQGVPTLALSLLKGRGFDGVDLALQTTVATTNKDLKQDLKMYTEGDGQPGGVTRSGYALLALAASGEKNGDVTIAVTNWILKRDTALGHWKARSSRPPEEFSDFTDTALAIIALNHFTADDKAATRASRLDTARHWLEGAMPKETEESVFRLWGLKESGSTPEMVATAAKALIEMQREDGGWAQQPAMGTDVYATASVLTVLRLTGSITGSDPVYLKGVSYLLKAQQPDGTWHVTTRSHPVQPYFESGFPYTKDQFISTAASAWAVAALALSTEPTVKL